MQTLPFKPLTTAIVVAAMFPTFAVAAATYGVDARENDQIVTGTSTFEGFDYGVSVSKGHKAEISNNAGLLFKSNIAGIYIKDDFGNINLSAPKNNITFETVQTTKETAYGISLKISSSSPTDSRIDLSGENLTFITTSKEFINSNSSAQGIQNKGPANPTKSFDGFIDIDVSKKLLIKSEALANARGISTLGAHANTEIKAATLDVQALITKSESKLSGNVFGISSEDNGVTEVVAGDVSIFVQNNLKGKTYGLHSKAGATSKYVVDRNSLIKIEANTVDVVAHSSALTETTTVGIASTGSDNSSTKTSFIDLSANSIAVSAFGQDATGVLSALGGSLSLGTEVTDNITVSSTLPEDIETDGKIKKFTGLASYAWDKNLRSEMDVKAKQINIESIADNTAIGISTGSNSIMNIGSSATDRISIRAVAKGDTDNTHAYGVWVNNTELGASSSKPGTLQSTGGEANLVGNSVDIYAEGNSDVRGVYVASSLMAPTKKAELNIKADSIRIEAKNTGTTQKSEGISAMSTGVVNLEGNTFVKADYAILARGDASVQINKDGKHSTQLEGNIVFDYDKASSGTGINADVDVTLSGADSYWKGNTMIHWNGLPKDEAKASNAAELLKVTDMKLTIKNGAEWIPTAVASTDAEAENGQSALALNSLTLDKGVVKVDSKVEVNVEKMSGTGTVKLATDLTAEEGAQAGTFTVGSAAEDSALTVKLTNADMTKDLTADDVTPEQAQKLIGNVEAADAETTMVVDEGMYNGAFDVTEEGSTISHGPNSVMQSTLELAAAAPLALNRILTNDVHKRMGDIRSMKETSGAWVRYDGGKLSAESGLDNDFHTIQVGVDTVPAADAPRFGLAFSYTKSDADYNRGEADMDAYSLAAYGLWMGDAGQFVDVVARLGTANTDMTVDGNKKGSMDNVVTALSGEFGWRFDFAKSFYVEPQVELAYTHVDADSLSLSDGSTYRFDDADSLMGRAGFALGLQCPENGNTAYLRVSAVHEFLGDAAVTGGNGTVYEIDGKDTWVEYGLGANFNITDTTYVWADLERTSGGVLDEDYRATIGVRHAF